MPFPAAIKLFLATLTFAAVAIVPIQQEIRPDCDTGLMICNQRRQEIAICSNNKFVMYERCAGPTCKYHATYGNPFCDDPYMGWHPWKA
ncbi:hypothetical protein BU24DRAFT_490541 [Aaosphaeria arxii CBS 175.79]|uniref:Carbohydrate-binding module family 52 protein n=1 Tax=Aaosphaeria arxii CBS 175.79 TaxID=1450172 RepID=A0A6A5XWS4_9PLEO|nr:uncharacterized protein BU24DRAFT_490541 [Aaosphaeria arxii CBS 175.79]KAF2017353.1 hypothetical protein BU24DRAFT_490541 [Aaosphaeria arxii CBS 175.79]